MTLVFVTMFVVIFMALTGFVTRLYHQAVLQTQDEIAFQVAEAGLNYGRWRLAHDEDNFTPETKIISDQFAGELGSYAVTFEPVVPGSTLVIITSVGQTQAQPLRTVTLQARYGKPSLARYTAVINNDVWYRSELHGPVHANGGIRMDGTSDSIVESAQATYQCQPFHGCSPAQSRPGVWGTGQDQNLWEFPVPPVDYNALTTDLLAVRDVAQANGTYYGLSGVFGYQLQFNDNNTYSIYQVTAKGPNIWSSTNETGWQFTSHDVGTTVLVETRPVPSGGVIFVEDMLWLKGDIRDRVTVAAGRFPDTPATNVDIILNGDISYGGVRDGTRVLGAIAQRHMLIPWSGAENNLDLEGAFIAQKGKFHRRYYQNCCGTQAHALKASLSRFGMVGSNLVPATAYVSGSTVVSGYQQSVSYYDPNLLYLPPPYFPTSGQYQFVSWEEVE
jgi:hypothetical protein